MAGDNTIDNGVDPNDPYSTAGLVNQLMDQISAIITDLKEHPGDMTQAINEVFGKMQNLQGLLVGQSSETQSGLNTAITGIANLQSYGADKDGKPVQDINIFTGKGQVDANGNPVMVSPEQAFKDESTFLLNSPATRDQLDSTGHKIPAIGADGKPILDKNGNPTYLENQLYKFSTTKGNESVAAQLKSAVEGAINSIGGGADFPAGTTGTAGYTFDASGQAIATSGEQVNIKGSGDKPDSSGNYTNGCISNMWKKADPPTPKSGDAPTPDSSILNSFQSAMGTLGQAGTASSSTLQAYTKVLTDDFTASQGNLNKSLTATIDMLKVFVQGQKSN